MGAVEAVSTSYLEAEKVLEGICDQLHKQLEHRKITLSNTVHALLITGYDHHKNSSDGLVFFHSVAYVVRCDPYQFIVSLGVEVGSGYGRNLFIRRLTESLPTTKKASRVAIAQILSLKTRYTRGSLLGINRRDGVIDVYERELETSIQDELRVTEGVYRRAVEGKVFDSVAYDQRATEEFVRTLLKCFTTHGYLL